MEFLRYPHVISTFFNRCEFGPPLPFTVTSTCTWIGHPVSGLRLQTLRPFQTWFPFGSEALLLNLAYNRNSPDRSTKSTPSHISALRLFVNKGFQVLFHSPPGVLFTFPSQYFCTIGHQGIFRLGGWSPLLPSGFLVSRRTLDTAAGIPVSCTRLSLPLVCFPKTIPLPVLHCLCGPQPRKARSSVWPLSFSLAATTEIDFSFSSCRYLDVSVHGVPSVKLFIHLTVTELYSAGFPHSDTYGSLTVCVSP